MVFLLEQNQNLPYSPEYDSDYAVAIVVLAWWLRAFV